jgi:hypothetical protein
MLDGCQALKRLGYWPGYFHREVCKIGGVQTVKNLLAKSDASEGFSTLWQLGRLDLTAEAFVLRQEYSLLFTNSERGVARRRLTQVDFDIDTYLRRLSTP